MTVEHLVNLGFPRSVIDSKGIKWKLNPNGQSRAEIRFGEVRLGACADYSHVGEDGYEQRMNVTLDSHWFDSKECVARESALRAKGLGPSYRMESEKSDDGSGKKKGNGRKPKKLRKRRSGRKIRPERGVRRGRR